MGRRQQRKLLRKFEYRALNSENKEMFFVPKGFAHGFLVLSESATFSYICDEGYCKESEGGIRWDDPTIIASDGKTTLVEMVDALIDSIENVIVSEKDSKHLMLNEISTGFNRGTLPYTYNANEIDEQ